MILHKMYTFPAEYAIYILTYLYPHIVCPDMTIL